MRIAPAATAIIIGLAFGGLSSTEAQAQSRNHSWAQYGNARFQYAICYPRDVMTPEPEPENGDGRRFMAKDGGSLAVWGNNNAAEATLKEEADQSAERLTGAAGRIAYRAMRKSWAVISGEGPSGLFYSKIFIDPKADQFKHFELTYPKASAEFYKPIVEKVAGCFADLK